MRDVRSMFQRAGLLAYRIRHRLDRDVSRLSDKLSVLFKGSFPAIHRLPVGPVSTRFAFLQERSAVRLQAMEPKVATLLVQQSDAALRHAFDLLGSGPTVVEHGLECRGFEGTRYPPSGPVHADPAGHWLSGRINRTNLKESQRIWQMVGERYTPIDWQRDFISGYRWDEKTWHRDIPLGHLPGVDIKVPWELARLQHLPNLALSCHFARQHTPGFQEASVYEQELRNQILDFIATNPPGFGVNWNCAMDVAIRCANLLAAHDILMASGASLDEKFENCFAASICAHARHVIKNLEWSPVYRGNHYLANIVGLLFAAAYLPGDEEVNSWLVFATQELLAEVQYQFHEDGSNFEASVCYHRLSAEMVLWGFAALAGLSPAQKAVLAQPERHRLRALPRLRPRAVEMHPIPGGDGRTSPVTPWCWDRLRRMADFTEALTRPDGTVVQFGDNDSGRFITLISSEQVRAGNDPSSPLWSLDHAALVAGIRTLLGGLTHMHAPDDASAWLVRGFAGLDEPDATRSGNVGIPLGHGNAQCLVGDDSVWHECLHKLEQTPPASRWTDRFAASSTGLADGVQQTAFPGMGCFVFRSERLFLAVRCGEIGVAGLGAHAHGDQLAIELVMDGESHFRDPGTYVYTPSLQMRNAYRSAHVHPVPHVEGREPVNLNLGPFDLRGAAPGECLYVGPLGFIGRHAGYGAQVLRIVALEDGGITIHDVAEGGLTLSSPKPDPLPFSQAYGRLLK